MVERKSKKTKKSKDTQKQKQKQKQKQTQSVKVNVNVKNINTRRTRTGFRPPFTSLRGQQIQRSVPTSINVQSGGQDSALLMQQVALNNGLMAVTRNMNDIQNAINNLEQPPLATRSRLSRNNPVEELSIEGLRRERIRAFETISERELETPSIDRYSRASNDSMMSGFSSLRETPSSRASTAFSMNIGSPQPQPPQPQPPQESREAPMQRMSGEPSNMVEMVDDDDESSRLGSSEASSQSLQIGSSERGDQSLPIGSSESGSSQSLQMQSLTDSDIDRIRQAEQDETRMVFREARRMGEVEDMGQEDIRSRAMRDELNERVRRETDRIYGRIEQSMMEEQDINYADRYRTVKENIERRKEEGRVKRETERMDMEDVNVADRYKFLRDKKAEIRAKKERERMGAEDKPPKAESVDSDDYREGLRERGIMSDSVLSLRDITTSQDMDEALARGRRRAFPTEFMGADIEEELKEDKPMTSSVGSSLGSGNSWLSYYSEEALDPQKQAKMTDSQMEATVERAFRRRYPQEFGQDDIEEEITASVDRIRSGIENVENKKPIGSFESSVGSESHHLGGNELQDSVTSSLGIGSSSAV